MNTPDDARLKREFEGLRERDQRSAPDFWNTISTGKAVAARRRRSRNRIVIAGALLTAGLAAMAIVKPVKPPARETGAIAGWSSPTAFLLETPGKRFLSETPSLGSPAIYGLPVVRKEKQ